MPSAVDDERVRRFLHQSAGELLRNADVAAAIAQVLDVLTENKRHHALLDASLNALDDLLAKEDTRRFIAVEVGKSAPLLKKISDWFQLQLDERAALKIAELALGKIHEVREDKGTSCAGASTSTLRSSSRASRPTMRCARRCTPFATSSCRVRRSAATSADSGRSSAPGSPPSRCAPSVAHERIASMVRAFGAKLEGDPGIRDWLDEQILTAIPPLVEEHRAKIGRFIEDQINGWQEKKLVGELERHIGSDLQYIRINGTLVGGLAGLAIAVATQLAR